MVCPCHARHSSPVSLCFCKSCLLLSAQTAVYLPWWVIGSRASHFIIILPSLFHFPNHKFPAALSVLCMFAFRVGSLLKLFLTLGLLWDWMLRLNGFLMPPAGGSGKLHEESCSVCGPSSCGHLMAKIHPKRLVPLLSPPPPLKGQFYYCLAMHMGSCSIIFY